MLIRKLNIEDTKDFICLIEIFSKAFETNAEIAETQELNKLLANQHFCVFVVDQKGEIVGGLTMYMLDRYYKQTPIAFIYDVAIDPNFQGKGFGKALMESVKTYCKANGLQEAFVEAAAADIDAVNFYRKTNCTNEMEAVQFSYIF